MESSKIKLQGEPINQLLKCNKNIFPKKTLYNSAILELMQMNSPLLKNVTANHDLLDHKSPTVFLKNVGPNNLIYNINYTKNLGIFYRETVASYDYRFYPAANFVNGFGKNDQKVLQNDFIKYKKER